MRGRGTGLPTFAQRALVRGHALGCEIPQWKMLAEYVAMDPLLPSCPWLMHATHQAPTAALETRAWHNKPIGWTPWGLPARMWARKYLKAKRSDSGHIAQCHGRQARYLVAQFHRSREATRERRARRIAHGMSSRCVWREAYRSNRPRRPRGSNSGVV